MYAAGTIGCIPLCIGYAELSIPLALPFWVAGGMVVLQVLFCRWKGRPLFAAAPVSYTHLDVYKRQVRTLDTAMCAEVSRALNLRLLAGDGESLDAVDTSSEAYQTQYQKVYDCLLYTSCAPVPVPVRTPAAPVPGRTGA